MAGAELAPPRIAGADPLPSHIIGVVKFNLWAFLVVLPVLVVVWGAALYLWFRRQLANRGKPLPLWVQCAVVPAGLVIFPMLLVGQPDRPRRQLAVAVGGPVLVVELGVVLVWASPLWRRNSRYPSRASGASRVGRNPVTSSPRPGWWRLAVFGAAAAFFAVAAIARLWHGDWRFATATLAVAVASGWRSYDEWRPGWSPRRMRIVAASLVGPAVVALVANVGTAPARIFLAASILLAAPREVVGLAARL
jgi:hypothetical protein